MMDSHTPLVKKLRAEAGCSLFRSGKGDHDIWYSPLTEYHLRHHSDMALGF